MQLAAAPSWANTNTTRWNSSKRWQKIVAIMRQNHLEEVQCQKLSTPNQRRRGCSSEGSTKWQKFRTYYWTDSTSAKVPKDSPPSHSKKRHHVELDCPVMAIQGQGIYRQGPSGGPNEQWRPNYLGNYPNQYNTPFFNNSSQNNGYRRKNDQPYPPQYNGQQPCPNQRQSSFVPPTQPQAYTQAPRQTTLASDPILGAISQLMEEMTMMNSCVDEIQDFVKTNVQPTMDKKSKQVTFSDQLPSQAMANPRNQGASSTQTHNINHVHVDEEAVETTLAISSLRSGKALSDPYMDHPFHQGSNKEK